MSNINGVGIVRYPPNRMVGTRTTREIARELADNIVVGCIICLPNTKDYTGEYDWDFHIVPATDGQVKVIHIECNEPYVAEVSN